jgi:anti-anti-sigma regulatory factor
MTLKIQRAADGDVVVFALSGRIEGDRVAELQCLLASEAADHRIVLDLQEVDLVDRDTVRFLARCAADGIQLEHCPAYIREWIAGETDGK